MTDPAPEPVKVCNACREALPASRFHRRRYLSGRYGLTSECKRCTNQRRKEWRRRGRGKAVKKLLCRLSHSRTTGIAKLLRATEQLLGGSAAVAVAMAEYIADIVDHGSTRERSRVVLALFKMFAACGFEHEKISEAQG